jgi:hypothetical protein
METHTRTTDGHTDLLEVRSSPQGWEVRETRDSAIVRTKRYSDWHRVERALLVFELREATAAALSVPSPAKL